VGEERALLAAHGNGEYGGLSRKFHLPKVLDTKVFMGFLSRLILAIGRLHQICHSVLQ
jgi:hypothetical protein